VVVFFVKLIFVRRGSVGPDIIQIMYLSNNFICRGT